ncbi:Signal transduction histidine kinase CheA [hydrothermal vent metagenome]|uniref:Chemotaxis protein CheA n=1 Tax=hydrothermal vent metagenome TaxID=652676 RepID=A0A3B0YXI6_9ZZZZ
MDMDIDPALQTFNVESREILEEMEEILLRLEQEESDEERQESLNAIFRAAHTIKGSAGLFNLQAIVSFTHVVESLLDKMREGDIAVDSDITALLLKCADHIGALVTLVQQDNADLSPELIKSGEKLLAQLSKYDGVSVLKEKKPTAENEKCLSHKDEVWHISLRFYDDVLREGMDPLSFIRYLETLGSIEHITVLDDAFPALQDFDPESCYLGMEISFKTTADKETIESVFKFIEDDSTIIILPPDSLVDDFIQLIHELPEEDQRLGEILVQCGSLTSAELKRALQHQEGLSEGLEKSVLGEILIDKGMATPPLVNAALHKQDQSRIRNKQEIRSMRVDATKLDEHINLVGELVIASAGAALRAQEIGDSALTELSSILSRLVEEVRDSALHLRMVQVGPTFNKFQRIVRDMSKDLNKEIEIVIRGAETDLDKTVIEKISDPLTHLIRNSVDHGIELPAEREAKGKNAIGKLFLSAYHDSGCVVIEVSDDGNGLNRKRILEKAKEKGLVRSDQQLTDQEIDNLIFEPGFSTADKVTNISGRGVGMDVVKRNIEELRGTIEVDSKPREGSAFCIRLPLTLAIIDGFLVGVENSSFVIPLEMVHECVELNGVNCKMDSDRNYVNLRGEILPFIRLRELFSTGGVNPKRENVVVVNYAGVKAGLVVDNLMGEFQTVIKPLGKMFSHVPGLGGSSILGNGEVALILDVPGLVNRVSSIESRAMQAAI